MREVSTRNLQAKRGSAPADESARFRGCVRHHGLKLLGLILVEVHLIERIWSVLVNPAEVMNKYQQGLVMSNSKYMQCYVC